MIAQPEHVAQKPPGGSAHVFPFHERPGVPALTALERPATGGKPTALSHLGYGFHRLRVTLRSGAVTRNHLATLWRIRCYGYSRVWRF
jgi:hypothetical protein